MNILSLFKRKPKYRRLELKFVSYIEGDKMIRENVGKPESEQWHIAKEEDTNRNYGTVYLERIIRITKRGSII
jgi:hypothetical protein